MINLSISNIAWSSDDDTRMYSLMEKYGFTGLEIAPTRIILQNPYESINDIKQWSDELNEKYQLTIPSMQSIWYGRTENIFASEEENELLIQYTKKAIDFAAAINCANLVFGCPKNRNMPEGADANVGLQFFKKIGDYAISKGTVVGIEANPVIYNTNYINTTQSAFEIIDNVNSEGIKLNLDIGTMIHNGEDISILSGKVHLINHVHISEPALKPIRERQIHKELKQILEEEHYNRFVSIEMGNANDIGIVEEKMEYVREIFA